MQWKFSGKQDIYLEIAEKYSEYISLGILKGGDKLPSVRAAAVEMGVNPNTVARAYEKLEKDRMISVIPKKGVYVRTEDSEDSGKEVMFSRSDADMLLNEIKNSMLFLKENKIGKGELEKLIGEVYGND